MEGERRGPAIDVRRKDSVNHYGLSVAPKYDEGVGESGGIELDRHDLLPIASAERDPRLTHRRFAVRIRSVELELPSRRRPPSST